MPGATGHAATGLKYDRGRLWVSGAATGKAFVYNAGPARYSSEIQLATGAGPTFINDVVVTRQAAYFTDSNRPVIYKVSKPGGGSPASRDRDPAHRRLPARRPAST